MSAERRRPPAVISRGRRFDDCRSTLDFDGLNPELAGGCFTLKSLRGHSLASLRQRKEQGKNRETDAQPERLSLPS